MHRIIDFDKQLFLEINRHHQEWLDPVMLFFSSYTAWGIIAFFLLSYVFYVQGEKWRWQTVGFAILCVIATNLFNQLIKIIIARPRPIHEQAFVDLIHAIEKFDASYSFFLGSFFEFVCACGLYLPCHTEKRLFFARFILGILSRLQPHLCRETLSLRCCRRDYIWYIDGFYRMEAF
jgi:MFS family permease